jgi:hypothetical protein
MKASQPICFVLVNALGLLHATSVFADIEITGNDQRMPDDGRSES